MIKTCQLDLEKELVRLLDWLGGFGKDSEGGTTRFLYSPEWTEAQQGLENLMKEEGFRVQYDEVGNLFGRLEGTTYQNETVLTGSHVDTVKNGGSYDGQLGIVAGFLALKYLKETYGQPLRNLEVVSMAEEEGSRFPYTFWGSKNITGTAKRSEVENITDINGISFVEAMKEAGFGFRDESREIRKDVRAFIELHAEQGGVLEIEQTPIGIVQYIVGQRRFTIEVSGEANHAGTTPMGYRKDAMIAASRMITAINDIAVKYGDPLVATVGKVEVKPNIVNVVPGKVIFTIDCRHTHNNELVKATEEIQETIKKIAEQTGVNLDIDLWMDAVPVPMDERLVKMFQGQCEKNDLSYKLMHSGAGHDAQIMAELAPTAMLFVPSHKGISHSPIEFTEPKDLAEGVKALIGVLFELGYKEEL
ncbi:allantoate deiminase [Metabacillus herbersteinensis]|uniref:Allantoate deiminase n=1 Tax=Metabacillus herbersteinensis TaxID=283816 RepID=A0ABV6GGP1_9BACI